jgi:sugar O-acyltransferase (sialic acid O-acetyltransferase NeuD family)
MSAMKKIVLWGASGQAKVLQEFLGKSGYAVMALFDNDLASHSPFPGVPIYHGIDGFMRWKADHVCSDVACLVAIGGALGSERLEIQRYLQAQGLTPVTVTHPTSYVAASARLGIGSQILAGTIIGADVDIGDACVVNTAASIDHECRIGDGVHIAPGATLAGCVHVGEYAFIGAGAVVLPRIRIGSRSTIGAGAVVTRDVPSDVVAYGSPAKVVRKKIGANR